VITLGPPSESCELTRLRSASKNLQNSPTVRRIRHIYTYTCRYTYIYIFRMEGQSKSLSLQPRSQFLCLFSFLFFLCCILCVCVCVCVRVCVCISVCTYTRVSASVFHIRFARSSSDESSIARRFPCRCVSSLSVFQLSCRYPIDESTFCRFLPTGRSVQPPYMPLMSILRLAVFLSL